MINKILKSEICHASVQVKVILLKAAEITDTNKYFKHYKACKEQYVMLLPLLSQLHFKYWYMKMSVSSNKLTEFSHFQQANSQQ